MAEMSCSFLVDLAAAFQASAGQHVAAWGGQRAVGHRGPPCG